MKNVEDKLFGKVVQSKGKEIWACTKNESAVNIGKSESSWLGLITLTFQGFRTSRLFILISWMWV